MLAEFACPACAEGIPPGRLSCPHCGTVLAAVARTFRLGGMTPAGAVPSAAPEQVFAEPVPGPVAALLASSGAWRRPLEPVEPVERKDAAPEAGPADEPEPAYEPGPAYELQPAPATLPTAPAPALPSANRWAQIAGSPPAPLDELPAPAPMRVTPAAYVPPSPVVADAVEPPARILPRAWGPDAPAAATIAGPPAGPAAESWTRRLRLPTIDRERVDEAAGIVVLAGSMAAAVGFLLPWSRIVIGATFTGSYLDSWGLAGAAHVVVFLVSLGVLALAAIPNRIGTWLRTGVAGIGLGALLLGLAWPYAFGRLGAGLGVVLEVVAAALLLGGGLLSSLVQRHAERPSGV